MRGCRKYFCHSKVDYVVQKMQENGVAISSIMKLKKKHAKVLQAACFTHWKQYKYPDHCCCGWLEGGANQLCII